MAEMHPLVNPVVLDTLIEKCSLSSMPDFRLVCWEWYRTSMAKWRSIKPVIVFPEDEPGNPTKRLTVSKFVEIIETQNALHKFDTRPYCTLICQDWKVRHNVDEGISRIWENCGPGLKRLELHNILLKDESILQEIVYEFTPNLEELVVDNVHLCNLKQASKELVPKPGKEETLQNNLKHFEYYGSHKSKPMSCYYPAIHMDWKIFFYKFPNLQNIVIGNGNEKTFTSFVEGIEYAINEQGRLTELRSLDTRKAVYELFKYDDESVYNDLIGRLCQLNLPLTNLGINIGYEPEDDAFSYVFESHPSVETLHVCRYQEPPIESFPYYMIPQTLTDLNLEGSTFASFEFLQYIPNLKNLKVRIANYGDTGMEIVDNDVVADSIKLVHLEEFVYRTVRPMSVKGLERVMKWTENGKLTKFGIAFNVTTFRLMCEKMQQLEVLSFFGNSLILEDCIGLENGVQVHPNITWLKSLKGVERCNFFLREGFSRIYGLNLFEKEPKSDLPDPEFG